MINYSGKIVLVTGAAGNLGGAVAEAFLKAGGAVVGLDHRSGRLNGKYSSVDSEGKLYPFEGVDLTDRQAIITLAKRVRDQVGLVDVIVNTVGGFAYGDRVYELEQETLKKMFNLNVNTFLNTSAGFVPHLLERGGGKVITVGSRSGLSGSAKTGAYAAAKSALLRLTESMAEELKGENIQVNCVLPSTIDTPENRQEMSKADFSKWVSLENLAQTILFLASSSADDITGIGLPVYGRT
jgi:NAD(P)-dependent dehydrogenase (short-subunit alcohol dehydrogenase family)